MNDSRESHKYGPGERGGSWHCGMILLVAFLFIAAFSPPCCGAKHLLLLSWNLRPYWEFTDGFRKQIEAKVVVLDENKTKLKKADLIIPLGHRALDFVLKHGHAPVFAALVVAPELVPADQRIVGGIFLRLPPEEFLPVLRSKLSKVLGTAFIIGIPYTSPENERFVQEVSHYAPIWGLKVKPLPLRKGLEDLDLKGIDVVYFVPDPFLETEETIEKILARVLLRERLAVGYNRFFLRRGAQLVFAVDYQEAGRLAADIIQTCFRFKRCGWHVAPYEVLEHFSSKPFRDQSD